MDTLTKDFCVLYKFIIIEGTPKSQETNTIKRWGLRESYQVSSYVSSPLHSPNFLTEVIVAAPVIIGNTGRDL